jgi:polar amino acid transport system permease protein
MIIFNIDQIKTVIEKIDVTSMIEDGFVAYTAEIIRGAIQAVPLGQIQAGMAVGMSKLMIYRRTIAPQASIIALPGYSNEVVLLLKASSLASTITLMELTGVTKTIVAETYKPIEAFLTAGCIYLLIVFILNIGFKFIEYKLTIFKR